MYIIHINNNNLLTAKDITVMLRNKRSQAKVFTVYIVTSNTAQLSGMQITTIYHYALGPLT